MDPLALDGTAIVTLTGNPRAKRRIVQNSGAEDAYYTNDASLTKANIVAKGIILPGGVFATLLLDEGDSAPGETTYWTTDTGESTTIRVLDSN